MRLHFIYIALFYAARANLSSDHSTDPKGTTIAGINDESDAFGISGLNNGGVSHPQTDSNAKSVAAGNSGDQCRSRDTTRSLERRLQDESQDDKLQDDNSQDGESPDICALGPPDPMTPIKDFVVEQTRQRRPKSEWPWQPWPLPTEGDPCEPGEASICCELYYQEPDRTWTVTLCDQCWSLPFNYLLSNPQLFTGWPKVHSVNWFLDVCSIEWQIWCCPLDQFRWGLPHVRHFWINWRKERRLMTSANSRETWLGNSRCSLLQPFETRNTSETSAGVGSCSALWTVLITSITAS